MKRHYTHNYLVNPKHRVTVAVIGAGGTGSQVMNELARIDYALYKLGHPGLHVTLYDDDIVTEANIGRQLFSPSDVGLYKAIVLVDRINSFFGTDWECQTTKYNGSLCAKRGETYNITISCVDSVASRIDIGNIRNSEEKVIKGGDENRPYYWLDFGNSKECGQVVLGTFQKVPQPESKLATPVERLKCVDELFDLTTVDEAESGPSCSLSEALSKQDLFINSTLAQVGCNLLWKLLAEGGVSFQGAYVNLRTMMVNPIKF